MTLHVSHQLAEWSKGGIAAFDAELDRLITTHGGPAPARLVAAKRHAALAGGKRLRPYLVLESARLMGIAGAGPLSVAAALEFIHCYSLVHDDLPAMDNDDMRRGRPTVHRAYDEATAILVGDGLQTLAFSVLSGPETGLDPAVALRLIRALAEASGMAGMVGGQMLDLAAEGRFDPAGRQIPLTAEGIITLQGMKTGALIRFGAVAGALMQREVENGAFQALARFGEALGLAFQIRDDLIDVEGDAIVAGKATGKDSAAGKGTFVTLLGLEGARARLEAANGEALTALERFGPAADGLRDVLAFNRLRTK